MGGKNLANGGAEGWKEGRNEQMKKMKDGPNKGRKK